ncbi:MAG: hypothetical protein R3Y54_12970 [Eubacteriales bacterium]
MKIESNIVKTGSLQVGEITEEDLKAINKLALKPMEKDKLFVFKLNACDDGLDDRNHEPFSLKSIKQLGKMYVGKTVIKDHKATADNQIARVFSTELVEEKCLTTLQLKCYMIRTESNKDLIEEIEAGIKKEVSTSCRVEHAYCSICKTDNVTDYCKHWGGREYETKEGKETCYFTLDGIKDVYEVSLVAIPAQPRAGATKELQEESPKELNKIEPGNRTEEELYVKEKTLQLFLYELKNKYKNEEGN